MSIIINAELVAKMKKLAETGKKKGKVINAEEAFKKYPPEGTWRKDKDERIILEEYKHDLWNFMKNL